jgi:hypothetical protein
MRLMNSSVYSGCGISRLDSLDTFILKPSEFTASEIKVLKWTPHIKPLLIESTTDYFESYLFN